MRPPCLCPRSRRGAAVVLTLAFLALVVTRSDADGQAFIPSLEGRFPHPPDAEVGNVRASAPWWDLTTAEGPGAVPASAPDAAAGLSKPAEPLPDPATPLPADPLPPEAVTAMLPESNACPALGFLVAAMGLWELVRRFHKSWIAAGR